MGFAGWPSASPSISSRGFGIVNRVEAARTTWGWVRGMSYPVSNMTVIADRDGMRADDD